MGNVSLNSRVILALVVLASFSLAAESCSDLLRFDYSTSAIMPILGEDISPGGNVLAVRSLELTGFYFGQNAYSEYFYIAMQDQYKNGKKLMGLGDIFYRQSNVTGVNNSYFTKATESPSYASSGETFDVKVETGYALSYSGFSYNTTIIRVSVSKALSFGAKGETGKSVIVLAEALDSSTQGFAKGSVYLVSPSGLVLVPDGRIRYIGSCEVAVCTDADFVDHYVNTTCKSTLTDGTDYCLSETELTEFVCSPQSVCVPFAFSCPFGCKDGKCISGEKATCEDVDGLNIAQRGRTSGNYANGSKFAFLDECVGTTKVAEYSCTGDNVLKKNVVECAGGSCQDGKCVLTPAKAECSDTDGGRNYEKAGVCADSTGSYADSCAQNSVVEYYCDAGYCKTIVSPCDKCSENACSKNALVPSSSTGTFVIAIIAIAVLGFLAKFYFDRKTARSKAKK